MRRKNPSNIKKRIVLFSAGGVLTVIAVLLLSPLGSPLVSAVKNMFFGLNTVSDITYGGKNVQKVVYNGETVWEREPDGIKMQEITGANCPVERTRAYDARDNHSYWVQKLDDGQCWMLTNLAYAGDGDTTYGDTTTLAIGSNNSYVAKYYYQPSGTTFTTEPTDPSTVSGAGGQYGYLYNWCAAMGGQASACQNSVATQPDQGANTGAGANNNANICPKGWRLPTGRSGGEFEALNAAINSGSSSNPSGLLSTWIGVYGGLYNNGLSGLHTGAYYWSSTAHPSSINAYQLNFSSSNVYTVNGDYKQRGFAVRCVAK